MAYAIQNQLEIIDIIRYNVSVIFKKLGIIMTGILNLVPDTFKQIMEWIEPHAYVRCSAVCKEWQEKFKTLERSIFQPLHEEAGFKVENNMYSAKSFIVLKETTRLGHPRDLTIKYFGEPVDEDPPVTLKQIDRLSKPFNEKFWNYQMYSYIIKYTAVGRPIREGEIVAWDHTGSIEFWNDGLAIEAIDKFKELCNYSGSGYAICPTRLMIPISSHNMLHLAQHPLECGEVDSLIFDIQTEPPIFYFDTIHRKEASSEFVCNEIPRQSWHLTWEQQVASYQPADLVSLLFQRSFALREDASDYASVRVRTLDTSITPLFHPEKPIHVTLGPAITKDPTSWKVFLGYESDDYRVVLKEDFELSPENRACLLGVVPCITAENAVKDSLEPPVQEPSIEENGEKGPKRQRIEDEGDGPLLKKPRVEKRGEKGE